MNTDSAAWEPEPDGQPALGRKGRRWFRSLAEQRLRPFLRGYADEELRERVLAWYVARAGTYAVWRAADAYLGPRYTWGEWSIPQRALEEDVEIAVYQCLRDPVAERDAERFTTLEEWLAAEGRGELEGTGIAEPPARHLIEGIALTLYVEARDRMLKARPRTCPDCGSEFWSKTTMVRRCEACCESRRTKREEERPGARRQGRGNR